MIRHYETLTGRRIGLSGLSPEERQALAEALAAFQARPDWASFSTTWQEQLAKALPTRPPRERMQHPLYTVFQDLENRLGIAQGTVAPPDYRDYLVARIEEKFGSRYRFCKETGIPEAFLSQVLSGKKDFSLAKLREVAEALDLSIAILPAHELADVPATDLGALRRVGSLLSEEISTLKTAHDHLRRIQDPAVRIASLAQERDLFGPVLGWIEERIRPVPEGQRAGRLLEIIKEEITAKEQFLGALREEIAQRVERGGSFSMGTARDARQPLSRV